MARPRIDPAETTFGYSRDTLYTPDRPRNRTSGGLVSTLQVKAGVTQLFGFTAYSSRVSAQFIQLHDRRGAPAAGNVPDVVFPIPASDFRAVDWIPPRLFNEGCWIVNSTTAGTYTAGAADTFFDVQFL